VGDYQVERSRAVEPLFYRAPAPPNMKPMQYQLAGVEYGLERRHHLFGDAPGLGKTAECILLGNAIEAKHTLVVCPASLRLNWEREIWAWSTIPNVSTYPVLKSSDGVSLDANYVIISYALLANQSILDAILDVRWDHVILDEAHAIKDPKGNTRTRAICAPDCIPSVAGRITLASGTILPNQPLEVYNAARLLNWDAIDRMSLDAFREHYYDLGGGMVRGPVYDPKLQAWSNKLHWSDKVRNVPRNLDELQHRLRKHIMVRRLKEQVLHELPPKQWHTFPLEVTSEMRRALKHPGWAIASRLYEMDPDAFNDGLPVDGAISTARKMLGEAKMPSVAAYIEDLIDGGVDKLVVTAWHTSVLAFLRDKLSKYGLVYMDGSTSAAKKQLAVDQFQSRDDIKIILGQTAVIGEGWTLTRAQDVVLAEPDWVPGRNDQALDRIHRKGQTGDRVIGHIPVVPGTLDERVMATAIRKDVAIYQALDHKHSI
jgi:SWI/SNF-related matrix-associated actin-dependent regulator 1 of chromatin subfamily A